MAGPGDSAKKDNPRFEALTRGNAGHYYLARRYFNLSPKKWDKLPWWEAVLLIEGLEAQGILGDGKKQESSGIGGKPVDITTGEAIPKGFKTRRAG